MKKKLLIAYFVLGCVWTIIKLPTLLADSNNNPMKATLLAIFRIIAWPVLAGRALSDKIIEIKKQKKEYDESKQAEQSNGK